MDRLDPFDEVGTHRVVTFHAAITLEGHEVTSVEGEGSFQDDKQPGATLETSFLLKIDSDSNPILYAREHHDQQ